MYFSNFIVFALHNLLLFDNESIGRCLFVFNCHDCFKSTKFLQLSGEFSDFSFKSYKFLTISFSQRKYSQNLTSLLFFRIFQGIKLISNKYFYDQKLANISENNSNETHFGGIFCEFYDDIPVILLRMILSASGTTYIDQNINACKWIKNQRIGFVIEAFKLFYEKYFDPRILDCPIKKGRYSAIQARPIPKNLGQFGQIPIFIPFKGIFNYTIVIKTKIGNSKLRPFYMATFIFDIS